MRDRLLLWLMRCAADMAGMYRSKIIFISWVPSETPTLVSAPYDVCIPSFC